MKLIDFYLRRYTLQLLPQILMQVSIVEQNKRTFFIIHKKYLCLRSHLASECIDKSLADFVIVNLKMAGRLFNPHSQDAGECLINQSYNINKQHNPD